jgi:hypothetical protein
MKDALVAALADPLLPAGAKFLLDVRRSSELEKRSEEDVKDVVKFFADHSEKVGKRCAVVASQPVHYVLTSIGAAFADSLGAEIEVFQELYEAISWLESE